MGDPSTSILTRRALLGSAIGALLGGVASVVARPLPALAATDEAVKTGGTYTVDNATTFNNVGNPNDVIVASTDWYGNALSGTSDNGNGVFGTSDYGCGVKGTSVHYAVGVRGESDGGTGVSGQSNSYAGVSGRSTSSAGVWGMNADSPPNPTGNIGVYGFCERPLGGKGVFGESPSGRGVVARGGAAPLRLLPSDQGKHPVSGLRGDLFVDSKGRLWYCSSTTNWKQLA